MCLPSTPAMTFVMLAKSINLPNAQNDTLPLCQHRRHLGVLKLQRRQDQHAQFHIPIFLPRQSCMNAWINVTALLRATSYSHENSQRRCCVDLTCKAHRFAKHARNGVLHPGAITPCKPRLGGDLCRAFKHAAPKATAQPAISTSAIIQ